MFEFHAYDRRAQARPPSAPHPDHALLASTGDIAAASFLFWSEHCVECAAPACYATCGLYRPRSDGRCRRFAFGIFRNSRYAGLRGYGAEIAFGRWGKLKANGNTVMEPFWALVRRERWLERTIPLRRELGRVAATLGRETVWVDPSRHLDRRARRLHRRASHGSTGQGGRAGLRPDAFLIEVYNPGHADVSLELEMRVAADLIDAAAARQAPPPVRRTVGLAPGHNRHVIPYEAFATVVGAYLPFKLSVAPMGEATPHLVFLALDFVAWRTVPDSADPAPVAQAERPAIKCAVFDLDDTVWQGTLVEGGAARLRPDARRVLSELDRRGILLAIASKNDPGPALQRLHRFGIAEMFVAAKIDWRAKSVAIREIAIALNLGLDAFAFVDDSAFERAEVAAALPAVSCFDARDLGHLPDHPRLRGGTSAVAGDRRRLYAQAARRDALRAAFADDEAFLRSCRLRLEIAAYRARDFDRVVELAQRTNQLNASGRTYSPEACAVLLADDRLEKLILRCGDAHGDYGLIGFAPVRFVDAPGTVAGARAGQLRIEEFMLSCRVQGRRLERAFFDHLATSDRGSAAGSLWIDFRETGRNGPLAQVLGDLGFYPWVDGGRRLDLPAPGLACDLIETVAIASAKKRRSAA